MSFTIGLATVTNKPALLEQNLPYMVGGGISKCSIINHCSESDTQLGFGSAHGPTNLIVRNFAGKFHEARNLSFELLDTSAKVVWNDDHIFSTEGGSLLFKRRVEEAVDRFGLGNHVFIMPTFAIHPRLLTKAKPFTGISGDAAVCVGNAAGITFSEDEKYADRQRHLGRGVVSYIGACGVLHLDQIKPFKLIAYRGLLNSLLRNFNEDHQTMEAAWEARTGQPITDTVKRLALKMGTRPGDYFLRAPDSYVDQLPNHLKSLAHLSVREFREHMFGEDLPLDFNIDELDEFEPDNYISNRWQHTDF